MGKYPVRGIGPAATRVEIPRIGLPEQQLHLSGIAGARFFELSRDLLCCVTSDGYLEQTNPAWKPILGYSAADLHGLKFIDLIHPADRPQAMAGLVDAVSDSTPAGEFEQRWRAKNGSYRWISWASRIDVEEGVVHARGTDVTERRRAETERREASAALSEANRELEGRAAELRRSNEELEQFAYVASHDLAEPLRSISGFSQFLAAEYGDRLDAEGLEYLDYIVDGARRLRTLIDALLEYSRVGRERPSIGPVSVQAVFDEVTASLRATIEEGDAVVSATTELPTVLADRSELSRVFQNLVTNSIKFAGASPPRVEIGADLEDGMWRFSIDDNGIGVEAAYADRIFGMFKRLHDRDSYPGAGIGLTIAKRIVERHGGRIWAEPRPGGGSTFRFTLPAKEPSVAA